MPNAIVIAGPTASGKSALALTLAEKLGGEIINADAMQVYRDLRILTARPTEAEEGMVPHHLYGVADGADAWSAGRFAREAAKVVEDIAARGKVPIVVGGTGLWLKALTVGLSPIPPVPDEVQAEAAARLLEVGMDSFREEVLANDPAMAALKPMDRQRHLRSWSVYRTTGKPLSEWQAEPPQPVTDIPFNGYVLCPPREQLYDQCNTRFEKMVEIGALEEVRGLRQRALPDHLPVMKAVGGPELTSYLAEDMSLPEAIAAAQQATRRLAKRQMTWFRGQAGDWPVFETGKGIIEMACKAVP